MKISARNQLKGKIKSVKLGAIMAEVELDIGGQTLVSVITKTSVDNLHLAQGDDVTVIVKSTAVMVGK